MLPWRSRPKCASRSSRGCLRTMRVPSPLPLTTRRRTRASESTYLTHDGARSRGRTILDGQHGPREVGNLTSSIVRDRTMRETGSTGWPACTPPPRPLPRGWRRPTTAWGMRLLGCASESFSPLPLSRGRSVPSAGRGAAFSMWRLLARIPLKGPLRASPDGRGGARCGIWA